MRLAAMARLAAAAGVALGLAFGPTGGAAQPAQGAPVVLKVMVFPGISNLSLFAAHAQGYFAKRGLRVELMATRSSQELRRGLAEGRHQIAHAGVDNAVAMAELDKADVAVVIGGHAGFGELFLQTDVETFSDVRGRRVIVDAPNTAYALVLYKILKDHGLGRDEYVVKPAGGTAQMLDAIIKDRYAAAVILSPPFSFQADRAGLRNLGPAAGGTYQFDAGFVMRGWAQANAGALVRYLQAYVEGCRWALDAGNVEPAIALLMDRLGLSRQDASRIYATITDPLTGYARDARLDPEGFKATLQLRAEIEGQWGGTPPPAARYLDLSYYEQALKGL